MRIEKLYKSYGDVDVLSDFSYDFNDKGMYVLFGYSGCGKSTLLNVIAGLIEFDKGNISVNKVSYEKSLKYSPISNEIAYITQDAFLVDYLSVRENLELCSKDKEKISGLCEQFGISSLLKKYPAKLSGGERQRTAVVQAILQEKKIILLDEPTASLDKENKKIVFELLQNIKKDVLIICACHDKQIFDYCDYIIDFENLDKYLVKEKKDNDDKENVGFEDISKRKSKINLLKYVSKQRRISNKLEMIILLTVFVAAIITMSYCYDFDGKLTYSLEKRYKVNALEVYIPTNIHTESFMMELEKEYNIIESTFHYTGNAPIAPIIDTNSVIDPNDFDLYLGELPYLAEAFPYSDCMLYGTYFTGENQVILSYGEALKMSYNPESLIGTKYKSKLYDKEYEYEIIGIFKTMEKDMNIYLKTILKHHNDMGIFLNGKFTSKYRFDDIIGISERERGKAFYTIYFKDTDDLHRFRKDHIEEYLSGADDISYVDYKYSFIEYTLGEASYSYYLYPAAYTTVILAIILYYSLKKMQLSYGKKNICVYQYYGFSYNKVRGSLCIYYAIELTVQFLIAIVLSLILQSSINILNDTYNFTDFTLFKMDWQRNVSIYLIFLVVSSISAITMFSTIKAKGWYQLLMERRDLL